MSQLAVRNNDNPLLKPSDLRPSAEGLEIECLLNPGVFQFNGKTYMLVRVAEKARQREGYFSVPVLSGSGRMDVIDIPLSDPALDRSDPRVIRYHDDYYLTTLSHLRLLCSDDGHRFFEPPESVILRGEGPYESYGIEDCRVTQIDHTFYLTYTAVSPNGVGVGLITTVDWKVFRREGLTLPPHNKDCAIFERQIGQHYYMLHRPSSIFIGGNYIWLAESPDLRHWGNHRCIARTRSGKWDSERIGAGAAPVFTSAGWLEIYHGADESQRYCLGALLLDKDNPANVIARSDDPIMEPTAPYEQTGFFGNVIFTNGHTVHGDLLRIYYGASDEVICSADFSIDAILDSLR